MAEFCLECMNKYLMDEKHQLKEQDVTMDVDLCARGGTAVSVSSELYKKVGTSEVPLVPTNWSW